MTNSKTQTEDQLLRILLIDDDVDFVASMSGILEVENYPVETAHTATEAIEKAGQFKPEVALVDLKLGQEDGLELVGKLQEINPELTCVVVTAYADMDTAIDALKSGVYDYLRKPFEASDLFAVLRRCTDRRKLINEKKAADQALKESDLRFRIAFETSPDAIILAHPGGEIIDVNPGFEEMTGYRRDNVVGRNSQEIGLWKDPAERNKLLELLAQVGQVNNFEAEFRLNDGRIRIGLVSARAVKLGGEQVALFVVRDVHDLKTKEKAIMESEERFRSLVSHIAGAVYRCLLDEDWAMQYISKPISDISGYPPTDFVLNQVRSYASIIHPDDNPLVSQTVTYAVSQKEPFTIEYRIIHADGSIRWVHEKGQAIYTADGKFSCLDGVIFDITESKQQEQLLINIVQGVAANIGEDFFRALVDRLSVVLEADYAFICEPDPANSAEIRSIFAFADAEEADNFSYPRAGTPCEMVMNQGVCVFSSDVQEKFPEDKLLVDMGANAYIGAPLIGSDGDHLGILVVLYRQPREITPRVLQIIQIYASRAAAELERLKVDAELLEKEQRYRHLSQEYSAVLEGISDAILLVDPELKVVWGNMGASKHFCIPLNALAGKSCREVWQCQSDDCQNCLHQVFRDSLPTETIQKTPNGRTWGVKAFPVKDVDGKVINVIQIASDMTEKMRLRDQASRSAHLAALGELAAGVAHEINNPTGMILLDMPMIKDVFNDLIPLLKEHELALQDKKIAGLSFEKVCREIPVAIDEIQEGAQRIKRIVEDLKDFSRPTSGELATVDLNEVVRKAVSLVNNPLKKATDYFTESYAKEPLLCVGNAQRLEQVMVNLLLNACQSLPDRTFAIQVATEIDKDAGCIRMLVRDEGVGIASEVIKQITDPFFTTRREVGGTGLGLSVSSRIIDEHQGTLSFDSEPDKGTTVVIELSIAEKV